MIEIRVLLQEANEHHNLATKSAKSALIHAKDAGERLAEIKRQCKHGQFEKLIEEHGEMMPRTAQRYMQIYRDYPLIEERMGPGRAATISLAEGLKAIQAKEKEYYPPPFEAKASDEALLVPDEDLSVCPRNGLHEYEEGDDCCRHCHTPKEEIDNFEDKAARAIDEARKEQEAEETKKTFATVESLYCRITKLLDELNKASPFARKADIQETLDMSYQLFRKWRYDK